MAAEPVDSIALVEAAANPDGITLTFSDRVYALTQIYRRPLAEGGSWNDVEEWVSLGEVSEWTDVEVQPGERWEYKVLRDGWVTGFATAAFEGDLKDQHGKIAVIVEESVSTTLSNEIDQLGWDLVGDGWEVVEYLATSAHTPEDIKALYENEPGIEAVLLVGHVPVPYSGNINPDGHGDHRGAWPADSYYADLDGDWPDTSVNATSASRSQNHNTPGDGKFDPSYLPSETELQVGRIDMWDLPAFEEDEATLIKRYLDRNHAWRHGEVEAVDAAVIDNNFGTYAPGSYSSWLLSPVVGRDQLESGDFMGTLTVSPYLFGYGSGAGSYSRANGVATSQDFADQVVQGVFLMLFGSYFGDFDSTNNLLRASIAGEGNALSSVWGGRPIHHHYSMGIGESLGTSVRFTQNMSDRVGSDYYQRGIWVALLGDPTLRAHPVLPADELVASSAGTQGEVQLTWTPSEDSGLVGYHVYRATAGMGPYERVTTAPVEDSAYVDVVESEGTWWWMVRAIKLQEGPSGSYFNPSQGQMVFLEVDTFVEPEDTAEETGIEDTGDTEIDEETGIDEEDTGAPLVEEEQGCACTSTERSASMPLWGLMATLMLIRRRERERRRGAQF